MWASGRPASSAEPATGPCGYPCTVLAQERMLCGGVHVSTHRSAAMIRERDKPSFCEGLTFSCPVVVVARSTSKLSAWLRSATSLVDAHVSRATGRCRPKGRLLENDEAPVCTPPLMRLHLMGPERFT